MALPIAITSVVGAVTKDPCRRENGSDPARLAIIPSQGKIAAD
jgi:hypothetical protein